MRRLALTALAVAVLATACANEEPAIASGSSTTTARAVTTAAELSMADYFAALSNTYAESLLLQNRCIEDHQPGTVEDDFEEEAEPEGEGTPLDPDLLRAMLRDCFVGSHDEATAGFATLQPPAAVADLHSELIAARQAWSTLVLPLALQVASEEDVQKFFENPDVLEAFDAELDACNGLIAAAASAGFAVQLGCSDSPGKPPPDGARPTVTVEAFVDENGWRINPPGVVDPGSGVELIIYNYDDFPHRPAIANLFSGDPGRLPVADGGVDLGRTGVSFDEAAPPDRAYFGMYWPEAPGEGWNGPVPELAPSQELRFTISDGEFVLWDQNPGAYEAGAYAVLIVVSRQAITATYVERPNEARTCAELGVTIADLYKAYANEVRLLTAEDFARSELSTIDDLRFGVALQRVRSLGCDEAVVRQSATGIFCLGEATEGTGAAAVWHNVCDAV